MIIAATGHRPDKLGGYHIERLKSLTRGAVLYLESEKPERCISGMAQGWDTAFALASLFCKIPLTAAIPCKGQFSVWPEKAQQRWQYIVERADKVIMVSPGDYASWKMDIRNKWMVDHSDKLCALWNGSPGGTANCVAYARKKNKPVDNLWDEFAAVLA